MIPRYARLVPLSALLLVSPYVLAGQDRGPSGSSAHEEAIVPVMVPVEGGQHEIGSLLLNIRDNPVRTVCLAPFHIGIHEVTFREYDRFVRATGRRLPDDFDWGRGDRPVVNVSREEARAYARWLGEQTGDHYRLPSEEEWEVAARGSDSPVSQYAPAGQDGILANCADCDSPWSGQSTAPVGRFPPNSIGLHDMHGNVWEWTDSCYRDIEGACSVGVVKGGSWDSDVATLRFSHRAAQRLGSRFSDIGFRVLRQTPGASADCTPQG